MISTILIFSVAATLLIIAIIHIYWLFGGNRGFDAAVPEQFKTSGVVINQQWPFRIATIIVIIGLIFFTTVIVANYSHHYSPRFTRITTNVIGGIFLLRAIGDFRLFGLFKQKDGSIFSKRDTKLYIPLCLFLGGGALIITFL